MTGSSKRVNAIQQDIGGECDTIAEAALRFIISFPAITSVIPGMRSQKNLNANVAAIQKGPLSAATIEKLKAHRWMRNFYK
jgi:aryl-alcohol dehydrogenase-like predicted oxidoreductase